MTQRHATAIRTRFQEIAAFPDSHIDLDEASLLICAEEYPGLDVEHWVRRLDGLAAEIRPRLRGGRKSLERLHGLTDYLFRVYGLRGNSEDYYDPRNSFLNEVIERRTGIPISLGVLCMEIGRRVGVPLLGVSFPTHFLLTHEDHPDLFVDPFNDGRLLTEDGCRDLLTEATAGAVPFDPTFLDPVGPREILLRMLNNLKRIFVHRGEIDKSISIVDRMLLLYPDQSDEVRDRGLLRLYNSDFSGAIDDLREYLSATPAAEDRHTIEGLIEQCRQRGVLVN